MLIQGAFMLINGCICVDKRLYFCWCVHVPDDVCVFAMIYARFPWCMRVWHDICTFPMIYACLTWCIQVPRDVCMFPMKFTHSRWRTVIAAKGNNTTIYGGKGDKNCIFHHNKCVLVAVASITLHHSNVEYELKQCSKNSDVTFFIILIREKTYRNSRFLSY